ncbi:MAG: MaoC family dehydratase [Neomegalonema sp.]|nr:MaoC family dehydratase [Neomegalonema sp.]
MGAAKQQAGRFFEDFKLGDRLVHATPRTLTEGDRALYTALYGSRFALFSSDEFAREVGLPESPVEDLAVFHVGFGKTVPDVSLNAVANLGYAECRFHQPAFVGDTIRTESDVIGLRETSKGDAGVVWVRSTAMNQLGETVADWVRWVLVRKRDAASPAPEASAPTLKEAVAAEDLIVPSDLDLSRGDTRLAGAPHVWGDYEVGESLDHVDGVTLEEAEHMMATRLWQNTAKVHFDRNARPDGKRLIYGGHIISHARALSFNGLANAQMIAALNGGAHANPAFAGDTVYARSEVLDKAETASAGVGALRLRLVAVKNVPADAVALRGEDGKYSPEVLLDLDYWALIAK